MLTRLRLLFDEFEATIFVAQTSRQELGQREAADELGEATDLGPVFPEEE